jgi:hypothetical protein
MFLNYQIKNYKQEKLASQANASFIPAITTENKKNLVFMNNFYHKVAVASIGIALGFALGTHKEAKAVTFTFTETSRYHLQHQGDLRQWDYPSQSLSVGIMDPLYRGKGEYRAFYEFNVTNLFHDPNAVISSAIFETDISYIRWYHPNSTLQIYGFTENDKVDPLGVYNAGEYLGQIPIEGPSAKRTAPFDVLPFITKTIKSNNSFAGFGIRALNGESFVTLSFGADLTITTERVPEPTTIFGSAIGLCLGGWLKRRKSALQKKTTS